MKPIRSEILQQISRDRLKLQSDSPLMTPGEISNHFDAALRRHADFSPNVKTVHFDGGVTKFHLPSDWVNGLSKIIRVEFFSGGKYEGDKIQSGLFIQDNAAVTQYAVSTVTSGAAQVTFTTASDAGIFKDGDTIGLINADSDVEDNWADGDGDSDTGILLLRYPAAATYNSSPKVKARNYVRLRQDEPESDDSIVLQYGTLHVYTDTLSEITVPESECEAVADLAASFAARALSAEFSKGALSTIEADSLDSSTDAERWNSLAESYERLYKEKMKIETPST